MKKIVAIILTLMAVAVAWPQPSGKKVYECPMKCEGEKTYDKPGKCPVCGMNLQEVKIKSNKVKNFVSPVKVVGAMMNVMMKGQLQGTIDLDTIANKDHLYGFGPVEYQAGEIMIVDGKSYISTIVNGEDLLVKESFAIKAPFFAYQNIEKWDGVDLPDSVGTIEQLESFLDQSTKNHSRPFFFRITGIVDSASFHVVNLPKGTVVSKPTDAHIGQKSFDLANEPVELLGFFSTEHKMIFTHHDSFVHIHLITYDKMKAGHVENIFLKKGTARLYLYRN